MGMLATGSGATALHHATMRGDMEIVELLLSKGADVSLKNDLGQDAAAMCKSFPELRGLLEKRERKMKLRGTKVKKNRIVEVLGKRISTATPIQHEMWLISLENLLMLYGGEKGNRRVMDVHQELKRRDLLTSWCDAPADAEIIFVSAHSSHCSHSLTSFTELILHSQVTHEWLSWAHPDPDGDQLRVLCRVIERLKSGELDTEMDPIHTILYKHKFTTKAKDWKSMLKRTYFWVDWFSMPQPGAEKVDDIGEKAMDVLRTEGTKAIRSIPAYVERSDFILILVPSLYHSDRKVPTCYRTWRRRGWCLLELYAAAMARDSSNPPLLVRSERGTPMWTSPLEILKLSIGLADFTCCQRGHVITTETQKVMNGGEVKKIPCDKPIAGEILEQLIDAKINHLFNAEGDMVTARLHCVLKHWWMRGLKEEKKIESDDEESASETFKKKLRWDEHDTWFDQGGVCSLLYAVSSDEECVVIELLEELKREFEGEEYTRRIESRIRDEGYTALGIPGRSTALTVSMMLASPKIVELLIESGANVESVDVMGNDGFMLASAFGRPKNLQCWLERVKDWDLNRQNTVVGGCALGLAVFMGANKLETVKVLLDAGASLDYRTFSGSTLLFNAIGNEDSDTHVVLAVVEQLKSQCAAEEFTSVINYRRKPQTLKWKCINVGGKVLYRTGLTKSMLIRHIALEAGTCALNLAVTRGDVEIVKILLANGADPYVENDLGMNAFDICKKAGPFASVNRALQEHVNEE
jgi:ankyrin repeat protein